MSTSKLQEHVKEYLHCKFPQAKILENHRPDWLDGLELDFYLPAYDVAIEVQGRQHYDYCPWFHGDWSGFQKQLERDRTKKHLCSLANIRLIEIASQDDLGILDALEITRKSIEELWDVSDQRVLQLARYQSKKLKRILKTLQKLGARLERWRRKPDSEQKRSVILNIERHIEINSAALDDWWKQHHTTDDSRGIV